MRNPVSALCLPRVAPLLPFCLLMIRRIIILAFIFSFVGLPSRADTLNVDFSITSDTATAGTIVGEIIGLQDNAKSTPEDIIIMSLPIDLGIFIPPGGYSLEAHGWDLATGTYFVVSDGQVTSETEYYASDLVGSDYHALSFNLEDAANGLQYINGPVDGVTTAKAVQNLDGFSGTTYTTVVVPEPRTLALLMTGGLVLFLVIRRQISRRKQ